MFRLSRRGDYGLVFLLFLAEKDKNQPISLAKISKEKRLPKKYLAQLALSLKQAGIIDSREGVKGGYFLKKDPEKVSILEIIQALEGPFSTTLCQANPGKCLVEPFCPSKNPWFEITQKMILSLQEKTLADFLESPPNLSTRL
jgi:Rrf2 family protein